MQTPRQGQPRFTPAAIMAGSKLFRDYQRAFASATGLLPVLRDANTALAEWPDGRATPLRAPAADDDQSRAASRSPNMQLPVVAAPPPQILESRPNQHEITVPVRAGNLVIALLQIVQVRSQTPARGQVERLPPLGSVEHNGNATELLNVATGQSRFISPEQCASLVLLFESFAPHLAEWFILHGPTKGSREPAAVLQAKKWLELHYFEAVTMSNVAKAVHLSSPHFCRNFHRVVGTTFTEFLARTRIARARQLLAHTQITIAETAFAVGFQSISQFNRTFRKLAGQSPTKYRLALAVRHEGMVKNTSKPRSAAAQLLRAAS